jgi:hypothetical protein
MGSLHGASGSQSQATWGAVAVAGGLAVTQAVPCRLSSSGFSGDKMSEERYGKSRSGVQRLVLGMWRQGRVRAGCVVSRDAKLRVARQKR